MYERGKWVRVVALTERGRKLIEQPTRKVPYLLFRIEAVIGDQSFPKGLVLYHTGLGDNEPDCKIIVDIPVDTDFKVSRPDLIRRKTK